MGMRRSTRQELRKLREICRDLLDGKACMFCHEPLLDTDNHYGHGDGEGSPFSATDLTLHHKDGDHSNNAKKNRVWVHRRCHKSHHMTERWVEKRAAAKGGR
jgi:hypothetical protein